MNNLFCIIKSLLLLFFVSLLLPLHASFEKDSIDLSLFNLPDSEEKVDTLNITGYKLHYTDHTKIFKYALEALSVAKKINYSYGEAKALALLCLVESSQGNHDKAIEYCEQSLSIGEEMKSDKIIGQASNSLGTIWGNKGNFDKAIVCFQRASDIAIKLDKKNVSSTILSNIGLIHFTNGNKELSKQYFSKSAELALQSQDSFLFSTAYEIIGNLHKLDGEEEQAIQNYKKALKIAELIDFKLILSSSNASLASLYSKNNKNDLALRTVNKALKYSKELKNEYATTKIYIKKTNILFELGEYDQSLINGTTSLHRVEKYGYRDLKLEILEMIAMVYAAKKEYQNAFEFQKKHQVLTDSISTDEQEKFIEEFEQKYQLAQKEKELALKDKELAQLNEKNTRTRLLSIFGFVILFTLSIIGFYQNRLSSFRKMESLKQNLALNFHDDTANTINGINRIAQMIREKKLSKEEQELELERISTMSSDALSSITDIIWSLNREEGTLKDLVSKVKEYTNQYTNTERFSFSIQVDPKLDIEQNINSFIRHQLLMILKEALMNTIKHTQPTKVVTYFSIGPSLISVQVSNWFDEKRIAKHSTGIGLQSIKNRVKSLDGEITFDKQVNFFSLTITI